jgi:hypothetical protein
MPMTSFTRPPSLLLRLSAREPTARGAGKQEPNPQLAGF